MLTSYENKQQPQSPPRDVALIIDGVWTEDHEEQIKAFCERHLPPEGHLERYGHSYIWRARTMEQRVAYSRQRFAEHRAWLKQKGAGNATASE